MSAAPFWKIYDGRGKYQAACWEPEAAAALMGLYGDGATIRSGHSRRHVVWTEGEETIPASESYDRVAATVISRLDEARVRR